MRTHKSFPSRLAARRAHGPEPGRATPHAVLVFLLLAGCATAPPSIPEGPLQEATAEQLTRLLAEREAAVHSLKGLFRATVKGAGIPFTQRLEGTLHYQRPDSLRLKGFTPFGTEVFDFVLGKERFTLRLPAGKQYAGSLADLEGGRGLGSHVRLSVWAVNGAIGNGALPKDTAATLVNEGDLYRLEVKAAAPAAGPGPLTAIRRIWFDRRTLQVVKEDRLDAKGTVEATMTFEDFRPLSEGTPEEVQGPAGGSLLIRPFKITTESGQDRLVLTFSEIIRNPVLRPEDLGTAGA